MNVLITAGGTAERIDSVRAITNTATGALGGMTADCFAASGGVRRIFYVCGKGARRPETAPAEIVEITEIEDTADLEAAVRGICARNTIGAVVHSMAVSDYRVSRVTNAEFADIGGAAKISSDEKSLVLFLERTPKIISLFSTIAPNAILVGFKLLSGAEHGELIDAGFDLLKKNNCAYVLANDMAQIRAGTHTGYLIDKNKNVLRFDGKQEIARGITENVLAEFSKRSAV
jgi:phosphopantothenate-cysteine ligase